MPPMRQSSTWSPDATGAIVTLYTGEGTSATDASSLGEKLHADFGVEVEVVDGGQPHYPYLIGVE